MPEDAEKPMDRRLDWTSANDMRVSFTRTEDGGVEFDEHKMEPRRPYPFQVDGVWFIAVRRSFTTGDVRLYNLDQ